MPFLGTLPDISLFKPGQSLRSNQFLVEPTIPLGASTLNEAFGGNPFRGKYAGNSHDGAHLHFINCTRDGSNSPILTDPTIPTSYQTVFWPTGSQPNAYPAIKAVADGYISRPIDNYYQVGDNYRYGFSLAFANRGGQELNFEYSIEPMTNPLDSTFYDPFILVAEGDVVTKGDTLGYMYLPEGDTGAHIHFHISINNASGPFMCPAIFKKRTVNKFYSIWDRWNEDNYGGFISHSCMGYMISDCQNPFLLPSIQEYI